MLYRFSCDTPLNRILPIQLSRYYDSLQAERSGDRIPLGEDISLPVLTDADAHPSHCTVLYSTHGGYTGSFPGVKESESGVNHPPTSSDDIKERVEVYFFWAFMTCYREKFTFFIRWMWDYVECETTLNVRLCWIRSNLNPMKKEIFVLFLRESNHVSLVVQTAA